MKNKDAVYSASDYVAYMRQHVQVPSFPAPHGVILSYSDELLNHVIEKDNPTPWGHFGPEVYLIKESNETVGLVGGFGIGCPAAVNVLEELIASGVREFISIGTAGGLQKNVLIGDIIVCEKAIPGESTSQHYLPPSEYREAPAGITNRIKTALTEKEIPFHVGPVWTTDAPYREKVEDVMAYQAKNVLAVEMEASALFAAAQYRGVELGVILTIGDSLADGNWVPHFLSEPVRLKTQTIYKIAVSVLTPS